MKIDGTIYLDHQATTPLDSEVFEVMKPYFGELFGNPHSADHAIGWRAAAAVEMAAGQIAAMIGADADEVFFTSGATEANNAALLGVAKRAAGGNRNRILLGATEHKCVLEVGRVVERDLGYRVSHIPVDAAGRIDMDRLDSELGVDVLLVSIMAVNNEIGTIQDIETIKGKISHYGCILHCDAAQAPCAIDMLELGRHVDMMSLSGHKMYGPMGIGALFIRRDLQQDVEPLVYGGGQQNGLRSGTLPTALCVGLGHASFQMTLEKARANRESLARRRDRLLNHLLKMPYHVASNGSSDSAHRHPGNINVRIQGVVAEDLLARVQPMLAASTGSACTSGIPEPSHVLRAIGLSEQSAAASVRLSLGKNTSDSDVDEAAQIIRKALDDIYNNGLLQSA
ncbi:cysteine desulfurase family protein [Glycocaulis abyssi]|uniref:cysteine desulfurase family protein n=1 Tax=Glycocaulis abyssi TaxID=1433403 RepID=UPI00352A96F0